MLALTAADNYTRPGADDSLGPREHAVAKTVQEVADDLGATPAQVAIAWTRVAEVFGDDYGRLDGRLR